MNVRLLMLCGFFLASCAQEQSVPDPYDQMSQVARWPPPPAQARVRYVKSFRGPENLGYKARFSTQVKNWLGGGEGEEMVRPYAIAVSDELIAVADPGSGAVHLFRTKTKRYSRLPPPGGEGLVSPVGVTLGDDRVFVADSVLAKVFIFNTRNKLIGVIDGFIRPTGLAFEPGASRLYVADTLGHEVQAFDSDGKFLQRIGGRGEGLGEFNFPTHLVVSSGRLYVNDTMNFRIQVFDTDGTFLTAIGEHGDGPGFMAQPKGIGVDSDGHIFVAESVRGKIQVFDIDGRYLLEFGFSPESSSALHLPAGLAISNDSVYVADSGNRRVQVFEYLGGK